MPEIAHVRNGNLIRIISSRPNGSYRCPIIAENGRNLTSNPLPGMTWIGYPDKILTVVRTTNQDPLTQPGTRTDTETATEWIISINDRPYTPAEISAQRAQFADANYNNLVFKTTKRLWALHWELWKANNPAGTVADFQDHANTLANQWTDAQYKDFIIKMLEAIK